MFLVVFGVLLVLDVIGVAWCGWLRLVCTVVIGVIFLLAWLGLVCLLVFGGLGGAWHDWRYLVCFLMFCVFGGGWRAWLCLVCSVVFW